MRRAQGYTLTSLFISLLIMRLWARQSASATSNHFHGISRRVKEHAVSRTFERPHRLANASYQNNPSLPCHSPKEHQVDTDEHDTCAILDDTTFQKSGIRIEGVSKVFDHVTHSFIYGMKCLTLALSDGKTRDPG